MNAADRITAAATAYICALTTIKTTRATARASGSDTSEILAALRLEGATAERIYRAEMRKITAVMMSRSDMDAVEAEIEALGHQFDSQIRSAGSTWTILETLSQ
jgi:microsomal dipeptidase-like Zn-dependent dipeptidase